MSPNGSVSRYRLPCFRTWTLPRSVAFSIGTTRGSTNATPLSAAFARRGRGGVAVARGGAAVARGASAGFAIVTSGDLGEAIGLVGHDQGVDQPVDLAVHDAGERRQVEPDPVIGDPVLREVIGADLVRAIARAD